MGIADQIISVESGGNPTARNPRSSAGGLGQFIDSTWLNTLKKHRPDLVDRYSTSELLAMKNDPTLSKAMTDAYASDNAAYLRSKGFEPTPGNVYLAHFAGPEGAASILSADPNAPASSVLSASAVTANPFLSKMRVADLQRWAGRKMGNSDAAPGYGGPQYVAQPAAATGTPMPAAESEAQTQQQPEQPTDNGLAAIPGMIAKFQQQDQQFLPTVHINTPEPPGMARARALARAMAQRPLTGGQG